MFLEIQNDRVEVGDFKVQVSEFELGDLKKYANVFCSYRNVNVWSSPEVLRQPKKLQEPTFSMDVYSFGVIMWEIFHACVPFNGDLKVCTEYVLEKD